MAAGDDAVDADDEEPHRDEVGEHAHPGSSSSACSRNSASIERDARPPPRCPPRCCPPGSSPPRAASRASRAAGRSAASRRRPPARRAPAPGTPRRRRASVASSTAIEPRAPQAHGLPGRVGEQQRARADHAALEAAARADVPVERHVGERARAPAPTSAPPTVRAAKLGCGAAGARRVGAALAPARAQQRRPPAHRGEQDELLAERVEAAHVEGRRGHELAGLAVRRARSRHHVAVGPRVVAEGLQPGHGHHEHGAEHGERRDADDVRVRGSLRRSRGSWPSPASTSTGTTMPPTTIIERATSGAWTATKSAARPARRCRSPRPGAAARA